MYHLPVIVFGEGLTLVVITGLDRLTLVMAAGGIGDPRDETGGELVIFENQIVKIAILLKQWMLQWLFMMWLFDIP